MGKLALADKITHVPSLRESARVGAAVPQAIERRCDGAVALCAGGSLSHRFAQNGRAPEFMHKVRDRFLEEADHAVVEMWKCFGEGGMHDTAMLLGALGWDRYRAGVEVVTPCFGRSGTGQINAVFPVTPLE